MTKVSVKTDCERNLIDLKIKVEKTPKNIPIAILTVPTRKNCYINRNKVCPENSFPCKLIMAMYNVIATMSLKTPSPRMQENSLG